MSKLENDFSYEKYIKYKKKFYQLVKERLEESVYPGQENDFFFLTIPKGFPDAGREVPVDYKLSNLVSYFWNHGFITYGWDQGWEDFFAFKFGFISFAGKKINNTDTFTDLYNLLVKKFGKNNIYVYDVKKIIDNNELSEDEKDDIIMNEKDNYLKNNPDKIILFESGGIVAIYFRSKFIREIYKKFGVILPNIEDRLPGGLINTRRYEI